MAVKNNEGELSEELTNLLKSIASSNWGDVIDSKSLNVVHLSGAMTNKVYRISWPTRIENVARTVLLRVYGQGVDVFFNREEEIRIFKSISSHGYGPKLLGQFSEGRVEEFIDARNLSANDLRDPEISALIAAKMREFHNLDVSGSKDIILWNRLRNWLREAKKWLCSTDEYKLDNLEYEIDSLERKISGDHQETGFCHNDLHYGNIMINEKNRLVSIIDYELAGYNPVAYDIANHFNEMAADYHTDAPHVLDYTKYPGLEERQQFIKQYLSSAGEEPSDEMIEKLADDVEKYSLANHIFWGLWGLISPYVHHIDFDYNEYSRQRFEQYWLRKTEILNVQGE